MNVKETYLYFAENLGANASGDAGVYPASNFLGCNPTGADRTQLSFKALTGNAADDTILINHVTGKFKEVCEALADALNDDNGELVVFADEDNTIYTKKLRDLGCIDASSTVVTTLDT